MQVRRMDKTESLQPISLSPKIWQRSLRKDFEFGSFKGLATEKWRFLPRNLPSFFVPSYRIHEKLVLSHAKLILDGRLLLDYDVGLSILGKTYVLNPSPKIILLYFLSHLIKRTKPAPNAAGTKM